MRGDVRALTTEDLPAAWELNRISFGGDRFAPAEWSRQRAGRQVWGVFDGADRLLAKAVDRQQSHWFGGRLVPASGIAGVAVRPESRGSGLSRAVLSTLFEAARDRGAVIGTLFRTHPAPYRRLGCEEVGELRWTALPTAELAGVARPRDITLRPAEATDLPAVLEAYRSVARTTNGYLERSGPLFDTCSEELLSRHDGLTVAEGEGGIQGYASWDRSSLHGGSSVLSVPELIGLTESATVALLAMLGTWAAVVPTLMLRLPEPDPAPLLSSMLESRLESSRRWMLRVLDAPGAVAARGWPVQLNGSVDVLLDDPTCPWNSGPHRLVLEGGRGSLRPGGTGDVRLTPRGFAAIYAGSHDPSLLRRAGLVAGGDAETDDFLRLATAGPRPGLNDYF